MMSPATYLRADGTFPAVDLFCGGGGFSEGVKRALGGSPMLVINHDGHALLTHDLYHPASEHVQEDVFMASPYTYIRHGDRVELLVASPSCTHHSRAAGGQPLNDQLRSHPWVVLDWAREHFPPVIIIENVAEMRTWGPLDVDGRPIVTRKGETYDRWREALERLGYYVEDWVLNAADYGAPTARHRLFVVAVLKRFGRPVKPRPTHGTGPGLQPYRTAGSIIDWRVPVCSLWAPKSERKAYAKTVNAALEASGRYIDVPRSSPPRRPLADATLRRIAAGVKRFVLEATEPFVVSLDHRSSSVDAVLRGLDEPLSTVTVKNRHALVQAGLINTRNGERRGQAPRIRDLAEPFPTVTAHGSQGAVAAAHLVKFYGTADAANLADPLGTITAGAGGGHHGLAMAFLAKHFGGGANGKLVPGQSLHEPTSTVTTTGQLGPVGVALSRQEVGRAKQVYAFLSSYYGTGIGQHLGDPCRTVTTRDRFGLVTVTLDGEPWVVTDIGMRMLHPHELADAMGFGLDFPLVGSKKEMTARIGNAVCPDVAEALIRAQFGLAGRWVAEAAEAK